VPIGRFAQTTPSQASWKRYKHHNLHDDADSDDPGVPCLTSREVMPTRTWQPRTGQSQEQKREHPASLGEAWPNVARRARRRRSVKEYEQSAEPRGGE